MKKYLIFSLLPSVLVLLTSCAAGPSRSPSLFADAGPTVHPKLIQHFVGWFSDSGPPAVQTVNVTAAARLRNEFSVDGIKRKGELIYIVTDGGGWFGYEYCGTMGGAIHVLRTEESGGGSGVFKALMLVRETVATNGDLLLTFIQDRRLGDRSAAEVTVEKDQVLVGPYRILRTECEGFTLTVPDTE